MRRPKGIRTNKSVAKRFKITARGEILRTHAGKRHLLSTKSPKRRRSLGTAVVAGPTDAHRVQQSLRFTRSRSHNPTEPCELPTPPPPRNAANAPSKPPKASACAAASSIATPPTRSITAVGPAYRDRRVKKRSFRSLWQIRINAATRGAGTTYSRFIEGLKAAQIDLNRKVLADLAATDAAAFGELVKVAQNALKTKAAKAA